MLLFVLAALVVADARILRQVEPVKNSYIVVLFHDVNTSSAVAAAKSYGDLNVQKGTSHVFLSSLASLPERERDRTL